MIPRGQDLRPMIADGGPGTALRPHATRLHVVYRSHGGENVKARPYYYSKILALTSFVRATLALDAPPEVIFLNDGRIPEDRLNVMRDHGEIVQIDAGSNRKSYLAAIDLAAARAWPEDDLVWFAEDDYLYAPTALSTLMAGLDALTDGDYFSLYSPADRAAGRADDDPRTPAWPPDSIGTRPVTVDSTRWFRAMSTTSTFGVRAGVLRQDRRLLRLCPYSGGAFDHTTCVAVQGQQPFAWEELRSELLPFKGSPPSSWARPMVRGIVRSGVNLRSRRRPDRRRTLYAADPLPIWHMELSDDNQHEDPARWTLVAARTREWADR